MTLLDPVDDNPILASTLLALYLVVAGLSVTAVGDAATLPSPLFFVLTAGPLVLYTGYHAARGSTFGVWPTVTYAVVVLCFLAVVAGAAPGRYTTGGRTPPPAFFALFGAPLAVFLVYRGGRLLAGLGR